MQWITIESIPGISDVDAGLTRGSAPCEIFQFRPEISFNSRQPLQRKPREEIWGGLIHELLHAYLCIRTRGDVSEERSCADRYFQEYDDGGHGPLFFRTSSILAWRLAFPEFTASDVFGYGNFLRPLRPLHEDITDGGIFVEDPSEDEGGTVFLPVVKEEDDAYRGRRRHSIAGRCPGIERTSTLCDYGPRWACLVGQVPRRWADWVWLGGMLRWMLCTWLSRWVKSWLRKKPIGIGKFK